MPLAEANLVIYFPTSQSRMPLAEANLVIHFPTSQSRMPLAEANLVIHLAEANLINTPDLFILNIKLL
jgi:hypothetical protein